MAENREDVGRRSYRQGRTFEDRVAELYRLLNYDVTAGRLFAGRQVDLFITRRFGDLRVERAIECKSGRVTADHIDVFLLKLRAVRGEYPSALGTIVSGESFTDSVATHAAREGIQLTLFRDLSKELFDGHGYATRLIRELETNERYPLSLYIEPSIGLDPTGSASAAFDLVDQWLIDEEWNQLTLLGDVGTGKSFLSRVLAHRLATRYLRQPLENPVPVLIDLRNADRAFSLEGLLLTHLAQAGMSGVPFEAFHAAASQGDVVLLFDGFDEMSARVTPRTTLRNFHELARAVEGRAKVLLTCRTHYFKSRTEEEEILLGSTSDYVSDSAKDLFWDLISRRGFQIAYLRPFSRAQVEQYVRRAKGDKAADALAKIRNTYNLVELSQRPMLLEMIVKSIDKLTADAINQATLYRVYTDAWIHRDQWRDVLSPGQKLNLLTLLAQVLWRDDVTTIHYTDLWEYLRSELAEAGLSAQEVVEIDSEIRTASFLTRDESGNYGFAHKSYLEFFVARRLSAELNSGNIQALAQRRLTPEIISFMRFLAVRSVVEPMLEVQLTTGYEPIISENCLLCLYGFRRQDLFESLPPDVPEQERSVIVELPEGAILNGADLSGLNLEGVRLASAKLRESNLAHTTLTGAYLRGSDLSLSCLEKAILTRAELSQATLASAAMVEVMADYANLRDADCRNADLRDAYLGNAECTHTDFSNARLLRTVLPEDTQLVTLRFWQSIERLHPRMLEIARALAGSTDAADLVSEALIRLAQTKRLEATVRDDGQISDAVAYRVLRGVWQEWKPLSRRYVQVASFDPVEREDASAGDVSLAGTDWDEDYVEDESVIVADPRWLADQEAHPLEARIRLDLEDVLPHLAEVLSSEAFTMIVDRYVHERPIAEMAIQRNVSVRSLQRQLNKAREIARACLES